MEKVTPCATCDGTGYVTVYDSVPYGMGNTLMPSSEACTECLEKGLCPNCQASVEWNDKRDLWEPCEACGWTEDNYEPSSWPGSDAEPSDPHETNRAIAQSWDKWQKA